MNAIILYDSFSLASKAHVLLQRASFNAGYPSGWSIMPWRTQMLRSQMFSRLALNEAADAHLTVCAWSGSRAFHQWIQDWLEQWLSYRRGEESAIAILGENGLHDCRTMTELSEFSKHHGVSLIVGQEELAQINPPSPRFSHVNRLNLPSDLRFK